MARAESSKKEGGRVFFRAQILETVNFGFPNLRSSRVSLLRHFRMSGLARLDLRSPVRNLPCTNGFFPFVTSFLSGVSSRAQTISPSEIRYQSKPAVNKYLPYPRDTWAAFCPILIFIHFRGWAARNSNILTFENLGKVEILVKYAYFTV
jgi:hypothetical protein